MKETSFEKTVEKLEQIIEELENGELSLDVSLKKYEEGVKLARNCRKKLDEAKKKIDVLIKKDDDLFEEKIFDEE
ncbi:MAG: exodeoxyribonuclease VII small subunit [Candidatus Omnitrophica bacterium]|nr:exodeoxyribonuclease VII small subunit [Candidatus Omnitrophota bacterium]